MVVYLKSCQSYSYCRNYTLANIVNEIDGYMRSENVLLYIGIENDMLCTCENFSVGVSRKTATYKSFQEAKEYLKKWLRCYSEIANNIELNKPIYLYNTSFTIKEI